MDGLESFQFSFKSLTSFGVQRARCHEIFDYIFFNQRNAIKCIKNKKWNIFLRPIQLDITTREHRQNESSQKKKIMGKTKSTQ